MKRNVNLTKVIIIIAAVVALLAAVIIAFVVTRNNKQPNAIGDNSLTLQIGKYMHTSGDKSKYIEVYHDQTIQIFGYDMFEVFISLLSTHASNREYYSDFTEAQIREVAAIVDELYDEHAYSETIKMQDELNWLQEARARGAAEDKDDLAEETLRTALNKRVSEFDTAVNERIANTPTLSELSKHYYDKVKSLVDRRVQSNRFGERHRYFIYGTAEEGFLRTDGAIAAINFGKVLGSHFGGLAMVDENTLSVYEPDGEYVYVG